ncbi:IS3 family transposase [Fundicoccus ignavus]|uniref:IS3 family transposase n=1 Tax=Fundicoccus ignavus TaxID=2664442 RepID=A0A844BWI0_9LACT|nr:IS3 family transposase [Fundicoccus ignavus]
MIICLNHYKQANVNHKCVYRLMKLTGLQAVIRRKRYNYKKGQSYHVPANKLNRKFDKAYKPCMYF